MRISSLVLIGASGFACLSAAFAQTMPAAQPTQPSHAGDVAKPAGDTAAADLPDGPGKDRLIAVCATCHDPRIVMGQKHDQGEWSELIDQMIARGAQVSDADHEAIATYLAKNYPPKQ
jgi:cytochrome c5